MTNFNFTLILIFLTISSNVLLYGQTISGTVFEKNSVIPVEYTNIGIVGKNIGTVSDQNGKYTLMINSEYYNDTLRFSCIGYYSYSVKVSDLINQNNGNVNLGKKEYKLAEVLVRPKNTKQKRLGINKRNKMIVGCFKDSINGSEAGVIMKNKNKVFLNEINLNVAYCTYDTVFYRMNIYKVQKNRQFENILNNPIYVTSTKEEVKDKITVDVRDLNLEIEGDFLVTFQSVKNLGLGTLCFFASLSHKTYQRRASQGKWETVNAGMSISVLVDVEK
jgi:hypothetical protein